MGSCVTDGGVRGGGPRCVCVVSTDGMEHEWPLSDARHYSRNIAELDRALG